MLSQRTSFPEFSHEMVWVISRPKLPKKHFGNDGDMSFSHRTTSVRADLRLQTWVSDSFAYLSQITSWGGGVASRELLPGAPSKIDELLKTKSCSVEQTILLLAVF